MKQQKILIAIIVGLSTQLVAADWNSKSHQLNFTGSDLAQEQTYSATRGDSKNLQTLSYTRNDHQEVNDIFNRNQRYEGLQFSSTSTLSKSNTLHFSSQLSRDEQNFGGVISTGKWLFGLSAGQGQNFIKSSQAFTGINPYFIHGGSATKFSYYGANAGYSFSNNSIAYFGSSTVESDRLEDRHANYAGFHASNISATLMNFKRSGKTIGKGIELITSLHQYQLGYRQISRTNGAHSKTISVEMPTSRFKAGKLGFAIESVNNPLYRKQDDLNFMFTISGQWGKPGTVFNATEDTEEGEQTTGLNKMAVIGAGVVAGVVIASSGGSSKDDNDIVSSDKQNDAARKVLNQINPRSVRENREFGGLIFRNPDGSFSNTNPIRGDESSLLIPLTVPEGTQATAFYHTHAAFDPRFDNENFSPTDINSANRTGLDSYLGTPAGAFKFYDLSSRQISTLGTIAN